MKSSQVLIYLMFHTTEMKKYIFVGESAKFAKILKEDFCIDTINAIPLFYRYYRCGNRTNSQFWLAG